LNDANLGDQLSYITFSVCTHSGVLHCVSAPCANWMKDLELCLNVNAMWYRTELWILPFKLIFWYFFLLVRPFNRKLYWIFDKSIINLVGNKVLFIGKVALYHVGIFECILHIRCLGLCRIDCFTSHQTVLPATLNSLSYRTSIWWGCFLCQG